MDVRYADYSNAGAGLEQAVALLETSQAAEKSIVMLSDGEFLMENEALTEQSHAAYQAAMDRAVQQEIAIHVIGLGKDMENTENSIFQAASYTNGGVYYTPQALEIQGAIQSILTEQFGIKQMTAGIIDADGEKETITVELPFSHANIIRVLLTSDSPIQNVKTNFNANSAEQITGERYSLIAIDNPQSSQMELSFTGTEGKQVKIALIPEYRVVSKVDVSYEDKQPEEETAVYYDREAFLNYTFYDADNENIQLWTEEYFENGKIRVIIGDHIEETALKSGSLMTSKKVTEKFAEKPDLTVQNFRSIYYLCLQQNWNWKLRRNFRYLSRNRPMRFMGFLQWQWQVFWQLFCWENQRHPQMKKRNRFRMDVRHREKTVI